MCRTVASHPINQNWNSDGFGNPVQDCSYPRQNGLALALRELAKLERTLFTLQWLQDPEVRDVVTLASTRVSNKMRSVVLCSSIGRVKSVIVAMRMSAIGQAVLNLVVAAIILSNAVYLQPADDHLRSDGQSCKLQQMLEVSCGFPGIKFSIRRGIQITRNPQARLVEHRSGPRDWAPKFAFD